MVHAIGFDRDHFGFSDPVSWTNFWMDGRKGITPWIFRVYCDIGFDGCAVLFIRNVSLVLESQAQWLPAGISGSVESLD